MTNLVDNNSLVESPKPRARHQVRRSLTELASPSRLPRPHQHRRHPPSNWQHDARASVDTQEPLQTRHSLSLLRPATLAIAMSPDVSRRPSLLAQRDHASEAEAKAPAEARPRPEGARPSAQADALKQSLDRLGTFATETTKQLDDTYYAVLEKMSTLQTTVTAIKGLAEELRDMCEGFDESSRALESETVSQLVALGRFEEQEAKIGSLQTRVREGRARIQGLTDRVDVVRERIEGWERADRMWREKTRKRLKIIWSATSVVVLVLIALAVGVRYTTRPDSAQAGDAGAASSTDGWLDGSNRSLSVGEGWMMLSRTAAAEDERLRAFDEL